MEPKRYEWDGQLLTAKQIASKMATSTPRVVRYMAAGVDGRESWKKHAETVRRLQKEAAMRGGSVSGPAKNRSTPKIFDGVETTFKVIANRFGMSEKTVARWYSEGVRSTKQMRERIEYSKRSRYEGTRRGGKNSSYSSRLPGEFLK